MINSEEKATVVPEEEKLEDNSEDSSEDEKTEDNSEEKKRKYRNLRNIRKRVAKNLLETFKKHNKKRDDIILDEKMRIYVEKHKKRDSRKASRMLSI